jgi:peptidoglycan/LPS O-acetylase OafA/YrhL
MVQMLSLEMLAGLGWSRYHGEPAIWDADFSFTDNSFTRLVFTWDWDIINDRLLQLWTIPIEFVCSMLLFLAVLGTSRLKTWIRLSVVFGLMVHCHASGHYAPFEFLFGFFIADVEESWSKIELSGIIKIAHHIFWTICLVLGMLVSGWPQTAAEETWGFQQLIRWTPQVYLEKSVPYLSFFWFSFGAPLIIWSMFRIPLLQEPFTSRLALYCGDISYSIYIIHYYIVTSLEWQISTTIHVWLGGPEENLGPTLRVVSVMLHAIVILFLSVWYADIFWRFVDQPIVKFARWVEKVCQA